MLQQTHASRKALYSELWYKAKAKGPCGGECVGYEGFWWVVRGGGKRRRRRVVKRNAAQDQSRAVISFPQPRAEFE